ncbi:MAG: sigma 54-interacting transcriptional regulator [Phycisphaerae bacterium]|nr:sigma 54-interacting transcriptional regulator [Phycisphaerae bacterium]
MPPSDDKDVTGASGSDLRPVDRIILDSIADGVFTVDEHWRITSFNRAAEETTGVSRDEAIGRRCCDVFRANICESSCALRRAIRGGKPVVNRRVTITNAQGQQVPVNVSASPLIDERGKVIGGVETFRDLTVVERLRREITRQHSFSDIISRNHLMGRLFDILPEVAASDSTVLIEGESGTGKELFARAIHNLSLRKHKSFVAVNCGALPDTLLESELFGYEAGAFTDAKKSKQGRFALANGGTIFLDEIGDISPALQVRLLRVLQERQYEPLGATETVKADVRVVAATNKDIEALCRTGDFRLDLYYRIKVVGLSLPPLRDRKEDIPLLAEHFVSRFNALRGKSIEGVDEAAMRCLMHHDWPGNVRELENAIEHAFVLCSDGLIQPHHLPKHLHPSELRIAGDGLSLADAEARLILEALERNDWRRGATAKELDIDASTLWRKMKRLKLSRPSGSPSES